jgi:hypothetical protein
MTDYPQREKAEVKMGLTMRERQALTRQTAQRYRRKNTTKVEKGKILDQYI